MISDRSNELAMVRELGQDDNLQAGVSRARKSSWSWRSLQQNFSRNSHRTSQSFHIAEERWTSVHNL
jgi:aspartate carbamoyltransferase catalytic subunit